MLVPFSGCARTENFELFLVVDRLWIRHWKLVFDLMFAAQALMQSRTQLNLVQIALFSIIVMSPIRVIFLINLVLMNLAGRSRSGSELSSFKCLGIRADHLVIQQEFLTLRDWTTLGRCLLALLEEPQHKLFAVFLCFERLVL